MDRDAAREELRRGWRAAGWYADVTVGEALADGARRHPDDAIVFASSDGATDVVSLAALHKHAVDLAGRLHRSGIEPGSAVAVLVPANREGTEVLEALWTLGALVVPVVLTAGAVELEHIIDETGARHVIAVPEWRGRPVAADVVALDGVRVLVPGTDAPPGASPVAALPGGPLPRLARPSPADAGCVLYTSGSTAMPKGVRHSHESLLAGLTAMPADAASRSLMTFPAGHIASLLGLLRPLSVGGTTVVLDRWSASAAAALIEEHRLTAGSGTPFFLSTLLDEADRSGRDISSLCRYLVGAASVPPALVCRADDRGIVTWRTYGSTEHPAISTGTPEDPPDKRRLTDGRPGPGNEVRLLHPDGVDVDPGEEGEVVARGPKQFLGYQDSSLDDDAFADVSWFRTGDQGRFDADGHLVITDRLKDIIIRGGENISAREVEDAIASHPSVAEVAVCPAPDPAWGEAVCAFVRARGDVAAPSLADLARHLGAAGLAAHKLPARLVVVDDFPRTAAGKIRKRDLRDQLR